MEQVLLEYLANALWQLPLLAAGAWVLLCLVKPGPQAQHKVWLAVLGFGVVLPVCGLAGDIGCSPVNQAEPTPLVHRSAAVVEVEPMGPIEVELPAETGKESSWLSSRKHRISLSSRTMHWISGAYAGSVLLGLLRVMRAWRGARRLVAASREMVLCSTAEAVLNGFGRDLNTHLPEIRECVEVTSPMVVGAIAPVVLLPKGFAGHRDDEVKAALLHELAHVKRRDYMMNGVCQVAALPVVWHPATYAIQRRIRRTREMACDEMAAREMRSEIGYARCLLTMARGMLGAGLPERPEFVGLFSSNVLEERVMRLMETKSEVSAKAKVIRLASGASAMAAAALLAASFHVVPTMAAEQQETIAPAVPVVQPVEAIAPVAPVAGVTIVRPRVAPAPAFVVAPPTPESVPVAPSAEDSLYGPHDVTPVAPQSAPTPPFAPAHVAPAVALAAPIASTPPTPHIAPPAPVAQTPPAPTTAPTPPAAPAANAKKAICKKKTSMVYRVPGGGLVVVDGEMREMTPEERERITKAMAASVQRLREAAKVLSSADLTTDTAALKEMAKIKITGLVDSNTLQAQMDAAQQAFEAQHEVMNSEELQAKMADVQAKLLTLKLLRNCDVGLAEQKEKKQR